MKKHIKITTIILLVFLLLFNLSTESMAQTEQELRAQWEQQMSEAIDLAVALHIAHNIGAYISQASIAISNSTANAAANFNTSIHQYIDFDNSTVTLSFNTYAVINVSVGPISIIINNLAYSLLYTLDLNTWNWNAGNNANVGQNIFTHVSWEDYLAQHNPQPEPTPDVITPDDGSESGGDVVIPVNGEDLDIEPVEHEDDEDEQSVNPPSSNPPQVFETTGTPAGLSTSNYMATFFSNPVAKDLKLYVPGYAYFQGIVYTKGNITTLGPIRVIGGIISRSPDNSKGISLEKGAMLTTDPEYLNRRTNPPQVRLRVTQWEEVPAALKSR